ncbi:MAG TPA: amidase [Kofleriaceae bacterium]|nr:amidase [Kofleriaceae bacterium]
MDPLCTASATRLAQLIRTREVSSREVVEAHIRRIERVNPVINAVVDTRYDDAREEAELADARAKAGGELPPFLGVPCTIKECMGLSGMRKTSGLLSRRHIVAGRDGTAVKRLKGAGLIPLGVTNVSELMMWMETFNHIYGRTNNPYDPSRTVGGSSGGEGAVVGAGGSPMGLGADIGGSIRMPAFFNGVFGHKPTGGLVPASGHYPMAENDARRYNTVGPIVRHAEDLMPMLRILAGPDGEDGGCRDIPLGDPAAVRIDQLTVYDVEDNGAFRVSPDLKAAQRDVAAHLARRGARVEPFRHPIFKHSFDIWSAMMDAAADTRFSQLLGDGEPVRGGRELVRWLFGARRHTLPSLGLVLLEKLPALLPGRALRALELGRTLKADLLAKLGTTGVILYPSYPEPAPRHYRALLPPLKWQYTAIWNVLEFCSTQVPLGLNADGLPLGVQVAGVPGNDHVTIAVAHELERGFGGWVPPDRL